MNTDHAAVLLGVLDNNIILTKRSTKLRSFSGHVCLPGGRCDVSDMSYVDTAIREFNEELDFKGSIEPLFYLLPETSVINHQSVYPIVAKLDGQINGFSRDEVDKIILLDVNKISTIDFIINQEYPMIKHNRVLQYNGDIIWGLTAHILYHYFVNYKELIRGS
ncbi:MAG: CoA pyrophosphatase [Burkholderiales bacterium]|nr:CoA pyrophosphatase [Burkholderiales bacterium]